MTINSRPTGEQKILNTIVQWYFPALTILSLLIFDILCVMHSGWGSYLFTRWSTWSFLFFFGFLLSMPAMIWNLRKTQAVIITLLTIWLWAQILYYRQFSGAIPLGSYSQIFAVSNHYGDSIMTLMQWWDLLFLLPPVFAWYLTTKHVKTSHNNKIIYWSLLGITFLISWVTSLARHGFEGTFRAAHWAGYVVRPAQFTPIGILIYDSVTRCVDIDEQSLEEVNRWKKRHKQMFTSSELSPEKRDKIILILVESFDSWAVTAEVEGLKVMPTLNKLLTYSTTLFAPNVVNQTKDGHSSDGQFMLFTGMLPLQTGALALEHPDNVHHSLAKAFAAQYHVMPTYYDCSPKATWNKDFTITSLGFENRTFKEDYLVQCNAKIQSTSHPWCKRISDGDMTDFIIQKMETDSTFAPGKPWLVEFVTASSHSDYNLPEGETSSLTLRKSYPKLLEQYLKIMRYVDECLAKLLQYIDSRDDNDRISVVIIGDHSAPYIESFRSKFLSPDPLIPLIILNSPIAGKFEKYMGQVDVYPTLLDLFGLNYQYRGLGVSILGSEHPGAAVGPDGKCYGNAPVNVKQHLQDAYNVSDLILRYDLPD